MADAARTFVALSAPPSDNEVAKPTKLSRGWLRWLIRASIRLLIGLVLLLVLSLVLLYVPPVQNMVRGKAVAFLEEKTGSTVRLESLHLRFPLELTLQGLYVEDTQGDTLLYAERISTSVGLSALFHKRISLADVDLQGVRTTVRQYPDSSFNFTFIVDAFAGAKSAKDDVITDSTGGFALDMGAIHLQRVHFDLDLQPADLSIDSRIGELRVSVDSFALVPFKLHVDEILLRATAVDVRAISGEAQPSSYPAITNPLADLNVAFNTIRSDSVRFSLTTVDKGDSLWVALRHGELIGRAFDHTRQKLALREVSVEGSYLGLVSKRSAIASDSVPVDPPWLDQHDGFRYWTQDWDLAIDHLHVAHSSIGIHTSNTFRPPSLFDSEHIVYNDIGIDAHNIFISNERIAAQLDSLELLVGPDQQEDRIRPQVRP